MCTKDVWVEICNTCKANSTEIRIRLVDKWQSFDGTTRLAYRSKWSCQGWVAKAKHSQGKHKLALLAAFFVNNLGGSLAGAVSYPKRKSSTQGHTPWSSQHDSTASRERCSCSRFLRTQWSSISRTNGNCKRIWAKVIEVVQASRKVARSCSGNRIETTGRSYHARHQIRRGYQRAWWTVTRS